MLGLGKVLDMEGSLGAGGVAQWKSVCYTAHKVLVSIPSTTHIYKQLEGRMRSCAPAGPVTVTLRADVCFLPRLCTLRCSLQCRKFPISLSHWPLLPGLKPPSWDIRYLGDRAKSPRGQVKRVADPNPNFCFRCPRWPSTLNHSLWLQWVLLLRH